MRSCNGSWRKKKEEEKEKIILKLNQSLGKEVFLI